MVAVYHWAHPTIAGVELPLGLAGVGLFLVLSGYLITGILLDTRERVGDESAARAIRSFYMRRFLRLLPAYYFYLLILWIGGIFPDAEGVWWYVLYAGNFRAFDVGWMTGVAHLWSLALEEQFYLVAPLVVLLLPQRFLTPALAGTLAISLLATPRYWIIPPGAFTGLVVGCLLAIGVDRGWRPVAQLHRWWPAVIVLAATLYWAVTTSRLVGLVWESSFRLSMYVGFAGLVWAAAIGFTRFTVLLEARPVLFVGRISYGVYLWHILGQAAWIDTAVNNLPVIPRLAVFGLTTLAMAVTSYYLIEKPFLGLKDRFPYIASGKRPALVRPGGPDAVSSAR